MSLHFVLEVNDAPIGACSIQRRHDPSAPEPLLDDAVSTYDVEVDDLQHDTPNLTAVVHHRYGDGAWALVRAALNAALAPTDPEGDLIAALDAISTELATARRRVTELEGTP